MAAFLQALIYIAMGLGIAALGCAFAAGAHVVRSTERITQWGAPKGYAFTPRGRRLRLYAYACQAISFLLGLIWVFSGAGER